MSPAIELSQVSFSYGLVPVLQNVSLQVATGEFLGLVGPNAGGKSTLLKLVLGLLRPQRGRVQVLGRRPAQARRRIGYVPQYPGFARDFPISVEQVVLLGRLGAGRGRMPGFFSSADRSAAYQALQEVEADDLAHRQIGALSGGQLQRVLLARALVAQPEILILDEPTANIDMRLESDIFDELKRLNQMPPDHDVAELGIKVARRVLALIPKSENPGRWASAQGELSRYCCILGAMREDAALIESGVPK